MRLLLWVLLATLVIYISTTNAASAVTDSEDTKLSQLTSEDIEALTHLLAVESDVDAKRFLRGDTETDLTTAGSDTDALDAEAEERGIVPSSVTNLINKVKNGWSKFKTKALEKAFKHMMKNGEDPTKLAKRLEIGGAAEPRYEKLYEKYTAWWINYHTNAGT
ncbi:RxLR effector protein 24 [Phytophthora ramorum]|uniref:RxLR effector protein n=1 Tax=Phytophthora ramorum TaxID=164328 RepID=H3GWP5_PHYRM|nr:RxLR effector protein 24 [Phytophthora ramorum]KAH7496094.1 RxLR effector protein 24 [Phytophthora ramorum]